MNPTDYLAIGALVLWGGWALWPKIKTMLPTLKTEATTQAVSVSSKEDAYWLLYKSLPQEARDALHQHVWPSLYPALNQATADKLPLPPIG